MLYGWGCYMAMGRPFEELGEDAHTDCINEPDRDGMFDLLLGIPNLDWSWQRRWARDYAGMGLRGIVWTMPMGFGFGSSSEYAVTAMLSGVLMSFGYELGYHSSSSFENFGNGTPAAEFIWGGMMFSLFLVCFVAEMQGNAEKSKNNIWYGLIKVAIAIQSALVFALSFYLLSHETYHQYEVMRQTN